MSTARTVFWRRVSAISTAVRDFTLQDFPLLPANTSRNASVRVIRSGLAVQCFNILEDFLKARTSEALAKLNSSGVQFAWLPEQLQEAATVGTVKAIGVQVRRKERVDRVSYAQLYGAKIASTQTGAMELADIGFFHAGSNIDGEDLRQALAAFCVAEPWTQLTGMLSRVGISGLPAKEVFTSLARRRHSAAHDPNTTVSESDLLQSVVDATGIALGYDLLLSRAATALSRLTTPTTGRRVLNIGHLSIPLRFIRSRGAVFGEIKENGKRSVALSADVQALLPGAKARAEANVEALIVGDSVMPASCWFY